MGWELKLQMVETLRCKVLHHEVEVETEGGGDLQRGNIYVAL